MGEFMENQFKFDISAVDNAIKCATNARFYGADLNIDSLNELAGKIKIEGLGYGNVGEIKDYLGSLETLDSKISEMKYEAFNAMTSLEGFSDILVYWVNEGKFSSADIVDLANGYMKYLVKNDPSYYTSLDNVSSLQGMLRREGFSDKFIESLNNAFCEEIINKNEMYSREGVVDMAYSFAGMFAMFGCTLDYKLGVSFDKYYQGLYLGTRNETLGMLDCCNLNDWLLRCVGIDVFEGGAGSQYKYGIDISSYSNPTPSNEYNAVKGDEYYNNAKPGDIIVNGNHTRMILEKTEDGYLMIEEGGDRGQMQIVEYSIDDILRSNYRVVNLDALYRNTSATTPGIFINDIHKNYQDEIYERREIRGTGVFFNPAELAKELNLSADLEQKLVNQYNARNEHPDVGMLATSNQSSVKTISLSSTDVDDLNFDIKSE